MTTHRRLLLFCVAVFVMTASMAQAQDRVDTSPRMSNSHAVENADQIAKILGMSDLVTNARLIEAQTRLYVHSRRTFDEAGHFGEGGGGIT